MNPPGAQPDPLPPTRIDELRGWLRDGPPRKRLDAMDAAALAHGAAAALVPDLLPFLTSEDYVPCYARAFEFSGHALLAEEAMRAIVSIGVAPPAAGVAELLADTRIFVLPEACYDQGAYIGDYSSETLSPAGLAAALVPLFGAACLPLLPALARNARNPAKEIGDPARRAIRDLSNRLAEFDPAGAGAFAAMIEHMAGLPESMAPTTLHGFDLRDMAILCRKHLAALGTDR